MLLLNNFLVLTMAENKRELKNLKTSPIQVGLPTRSNDQLVVLAKSEVNKNSLKSLSSPQRGQLPSALGAQSILARPQKGEQKSKTLTALREPPPGAGSSLFVNQTGPMKPIVYKNIKNLLFANNQKDPNKFFISCKESRIESKTSFYGCFYLGPFDESLSQTLANDLRRTLLSELKGLAITSVQIEGVFHKFSTLPGMQEPVLDLVCNLQTLILKKTINTFKTPGTNSIKATKKTYTGFLKARGPRVIKAGDLKLPAGIQCVDPNQYIATLAEDGILNMKFTINEGKNYLFQKPQNLEVSTLKKRNIILYKTKKVAKSGTSLFNLDTNSLAPAGSTGTALRKGLTKDFKNPLKYGEPISLDAVFMPVTKVNCIIEDNNVATELDIFKKISKNNTKTNLQETINATATGQISDLNNQPFKISGKISKGLNSLPELEKTDKIFKSLFFKNAVILNQLITPLQNSISEQALLDSSWLLSNFPANFKSGQPELRSGQVEQPGWLNNLYFTLSNNTIKLTPEKIKFPNSSLESADTSTTVSAVKGNPSISTSRGKGAKQNLLELTKPTDSMSHMQNSLLVYKLHTNKIYSFTLFENLANINHAKSMSAPKALESLFLWYNSQSFLRGVGKVNDSGFTAPQASMLTGSASNLKNLKLGWSDFSAFLQSKKAAPSGAFAKRLVSTSLFLKGTEKGFWASDQSGILKNESGPVVSKMFLKRIIGLKGSRYMAKSFVSLDSLHTVTRQTQKLSNLYKFDNNLVSLANLNKLNYLDYLNVEYSNILKLKPVLKKTHLVLEIWTNGSIHPRQALYQSLEFLSNTFLKLQNVRIIGSRFKSDVSYSWPLRGQTEFPVPKGGSFNGVKAGRNASLLKNELKNEKEDSKQPLSPEGTGQARDFENLSINIKSSNILNAPIGILAISLRSYTALRKAQIFTIGQLVTRFKKSDLLKLKNLGPKSLSEIETSLANIGLSWS